MALGWGQFFGGIGHILDKLPIQGRKERWRNEVENLKKEKNSILSSEATDAKAVRLMTINKRLEYLEQLLKNVGE